MTITAPTVYFGIPILLVIVLSFFFVKKQRKKSARTDYTHGEQYALLTLVIALMLVWGNVPLVVFFVIRAWGKEEECK